MPRQDRGQCREEVKKPGEKSVIAKSYFRWAVWGRLLDVRTSEQILERRKEACHASVRRRAVQAEPTARAKVLGREHLWRASV